MSQNIVILLICSFISLTYADSKCDLSVFESDPTLIETRYGKLQGVCNSVIIDDPDDPDRTENVSSWLGVPYAEPPLNEKRFMRPSALQKWSSIRNASRLPNMCVQSVTSKTREMSEDCLYLNIYAPLPKSNKSKLLPVYIFIHGGTFISGAGSDFDPSFAVGLSNIIVVTINYRLGIKDDIFLLKIKKLTAKIHVFPRSFWVYVPEKLGHHGKHGLSRSAHGHKMGLRKHKIV